LKNGRQENGVSIRLNSEHRQAARTHNFFGSSQVTRRITTQRYLTMEIYHHAEYN
jgi:hypothetical protein